MTIYNVQPWPSTYNMKGDVAPTKLTSRFEGRTVGAFRGGIPPHTVEPPQVHLLAPRDGNPFEELLTGFDKPLVVAYWDAVTRETRIREYSPGHDIAIPEFRVHWLINPYNVELEFTCEFAPSPWDGDLDEPEFPNLDALIQYVDEKGLRERLIEANGNYPR